jgi:hypothetical protein
MNHLADPMNLLSGYKGKLATLVARGFPEVLAMRVLIFTFMLRRGVRGLSLTGSAIVYPPFHTLWVPESHGGVGVLPWSLGLASNVAPMMMAMKYDTQLESDMQYAATVVEKVNTKVKEEISDNLIESGVFERVLNSFHLYNPMNGCSPRVRPSVSSRRQELECHPICIIQRNHGKWFNVELNQLRLYETQSYQPKP